MPRTKQVQSLDVSCFFETFPTVKQSFALHPSYELPGDMTAFIERVHYEIQYHITYGKLHQDMLDPTNQEKSVDVNLPWDLVVDDFSMWLRSLPYVYHAALQERIQLSIKQVPRTLFQEVPGMQNFTKCYAIKYKVQDMGRKEGKKAYKFFPNAYLFVGLRKRQRKNQQQAQQQYPFLQVAIGRSAVTNTEYNKTLEELVHILWKKLKAYEEYDIQPDDMQQMISNS